MFCVVRLRSLRLADHSSIGFLPSVACLECDIETLTVRRLGPTGGCRAMQKKQKAMVNLRREIPRSLGFGRTAAGCPKLVLMRAYLFTLDGGERQIL